MTDCIQAEVRDALPDLLNGRLGEVDTATMTAHVEACEACRAELALLREVRASAPIAPSIDVASIVAALPLRTTSISTSNEPERRPAFRTRPALWLIAATAAIIAVSTFSYDNGGGKPVVASTSVAKDSSLSLVSGVQYLTDEQIETLLAELDGIESIPSAEPQAVQLAVESLEVGG